MRSSTGACVPNADSGTEIGLNWSPTRTFRRRLLAPTVGANPESDERVPVMTWNPVPGAISYDVSIEEPDGDNSLFSNLRTTVATPTKVFGLGTWQWRVRANFPTETGRPAAGPFSARRPFTRFMNPPTGARIERDNGALVLDWDPSFGLAKEYRVEFSESSSFRTRLDSKRIDNAGYAPTMSTSGFQNGGPIYWRVAAVDEGGNVGGWASGKVGLLRKMTVQGVGDPPARPEERPTGARHERQEPRGQGRAGHPARRGRPRPQAHGEEGDRALQGQAEGARQCPRAG